ncbi:MAG: nitrogen fixation protein NifQ [Campylobacterales bacterium]|nr:nitrogen fixation protein NifQ [Campylobacterales bacterium]
MTRPIDINQRLEIKVKTLLESFSKDGYTRVNVAPYVAKTSLMMNHLYQDLGFQNRVQMARFMEHHFPKLSANKPQDKLWKKYIYDLIGEVAPACSLCKDQENCFACKL